VDYARFVALRRPLWDRFEEQLGEARSRRRELSYQEVEELALRYRQLLQDHAFARSRFAGTGAAQRLARLAVQGGTLLQHGEERRFSIVRFFFARFPRAVAAHAPQIGIAVALFLITVLLGLAVAVFEPGMSTALLGADTVEELRRGHLWTEALTTTVPPSYSSSSIATNNMSVAVTAWAGGVVFGLGSLWVVLLNGFLLGSVFGVTARYDMANALLEFVSAHGPLELTLILVSAAAGLSMGAALLRADDLPRSVTVPRAATEAVVVLLGCLPWFVVLAIVEAVLSPSPTLHWGWKLLLGLALEVCFLVPVALVTLRGEEGAAELPPGRTASP
jgi:uncharacterized membrane protein SpoIIM required for sporulation